MSTGDGVDREGGEDPARFVRDPNGDWRRSAVKQVASGREAERVIEACGARNYQKALGKELAELRNSEMWRAGAAVRSLRPENWKK